MVVLYTLAKYFVAYFHLIYSLSSPVLETTCVINEIFMCLEGIFFFVCTFLHLHVDVYGLLVHVLGLYSHFFVIFLNSARQ